MAESRWVGNPRYLSGRDGTALWKAYPFAGTKCHAEWGRRFHGHCLHADGTCPLEEVTWDHVVVPTWGAQEARK